MPTLVERWVEVTDLVAAAGLVQVTETELVGWAEACTTNRLQFLEQMRSRGLTQVQGQQIENALADWWRQSTRVERVMVIPDRAWLLSADAGLCNKLRSVLSYRGMASEQGYGLVVLWRAGPACNGTFDQLFEPLSGLHFVQDAGMEQELETRLAAVGKWAISVPVCLYAHPVMQFTPRESLMYAALRPLPEVREAIDARVRDCGPSFIAVHVRRCATCDCRLLISHEGVLIDYCSILHD